MKSLLILSLLLQNIATAQQFNVRFKISEPCNVRIKNAEGQYLRPDSTYFWKGFMGTPFPDFPCDGQFNIKLLPGKYEYELDRGMEYFLSKGNFIVENKDLEFNIQLKRLADLKSKNWWSGEMHIHRKLKDIPLLMRASDIHIAPVIVSWNEHFDFKKSDSIYDFSIQKLDGDRYYSVTGSEDERDGGAVLVLNTSRPIDFSVDHRKEYPPLARSAERVKHEFKDSAWIDVEKPFWMDMPILLARGKINSIGIAHNHMNQSGVFDNEAWGRSRDKNKYPSPRGNGYYTQDVYYHVLNSGLRIPPSAGSASGVLMNPVGYNRVYAYVDNGLTYNKWFDAVKAGRSFITNGPVLLCKADGFLPGYTFSSNKNRTIKIKGEVHARDTIEKIEIIKNGSVVKTIDSSKIKGGQFFSSITFESSGWFLVRTFCTTSNNFRFASTAPYYVEIGDNKRYVSKISAQYFLDWLNERAGKIKAESDSELQEINKYVDNSRRFWENIIKHATLE